MLQAYESIFSNGSIAAYKFNDPVKNAVVHMPLWKTYHMRFSPVKPTILKAMDDHGVEVDDLKLYAAEGKDLTPQLRSLKRTQQKQHISIL